MLASRVSMLHRHVRLSMLSTRSMAHVRWMSATADETLRTRLTSELKSAMKAKNTSQSTLLRSVLAEVYSADKMTEDGSKIPDPSIEKIMRKNILKRVEAANQFTAAQRPDLAEKESREIGVLQTFLPPMPTEGDVDRVLREVMEAEQISASEGKKALGLLFKAFYAKIAKDTVDPDMVKRKAGKLLGL